MKNLHPLFWLFLFGFILPISAQNSIDIEELLERHSQTYMGSINDIFTPEELQVLQEHFNEVNASNQAPSLPLVLGQSTRGNVPVSVVEILVETLQIINHGPSPLPNFEGAGIVFSNPNNGSAIIDNTNRVHIRGINSTAYENQGLLDIYQFPDGVITGMERLSNGNVYAIATNGVDDSRLYQVDYSNWVATPIGDNNGLTVPINLVRDGSDKLYTLDIDDDVVYELDKNTGLATYVGDSGFDANFGQGGAYDDITGKLYFIAYNAALGDSELRELNFMTGMTTSVGVITPGDQDQFGWIDFYDADILGLNQSNFNEFTYFPNPTKNEFTIKANEVIDSIEIFNVLGQKVHQQSIEALQKTINIEELPNAQYFLKVSIDGENETFKLLKN